MEQGKKEKKKMSATTRVQGHEIQYDHELDSWKYRDTKELVTPSNIRKCIKCGNKESEQGHDFCIQNLGKVINACCGHGVEKGYIQFDDGTIVEGNFKIIKGEK